MTYFNNQYYSKKLIAAIREEDVAKVELLTKSIFGNVNSLPILSRYIAKMTEQNISTPLQEACEKGNHDIIKMLLDKGADPNIVGTYDAYPLSLAAVYGGEGRFELIKLLVENGANVNNGAIVAFVPRSISSDSVKILEFLEGYGAVIDEKIFWVACRRADSAVIRFLVTDRNLDVNYRDKDDGSTPLISFVYPYYDDREKKLTT